MADRPLNVKDRAPEVGDVLYCTIPDFDPEKEWVVVGFRDCRGHESPMVRTKTYPKGNTIIKPLWSAFAYRSRRDGGPVTVEAGVETGEGGEG